MTCDNLNQQSQLQDSWCNTQAVKGYKGTLIYFSVYLLPSVAQTDKKETLQAKNEAAALVEKKQDSSCQMLKGKKGTDNRSFTNI